LGTVSPVRRGKWPGREVYLSPPSSATVKNGQSHKCTHSVCFHVQKREEFTLHLQYSDHCEK